MKITVTSPLESVAAFALAFAAGIASTAIVAGYGLRATGYGLRAVGEAPRLDGAPSRLSGHRSGLSPSPQAILATLLRLGGTPPHHSNKRGDTR